jgi:hypothetical protein
MKDSAHLQQSTVAFRSDSYVVKRAVNGGMYGGSVVPLLALGRFWIPLGSMLIAVGPASITVADAAKAVRECSPN